MNQPHQMTKDNKDGFVHLHVHSEYSMLDGASKVKGLCRKAAEQGSPAIAMTDHGVMHGALEFYEEAKEHNLKAIIGVEAYISPTNRFDKSIRNEAHVTLLAADAEGYHNIVKLVSAGFTEGYYYKPRIDMDILEKYNKGIICLTGCLSGLVQEPLKTGDYKSALAAAQAYKDIFGDRVYLEMMRHGIMEQDMVEANMLKIRDATGMKLVATNDSHYTNHKDHEFHDLLLCIQTGATTSTPEDKRFHFHGDQFYVKSPAEMRKTFIDMPEACDATLEIADRVDLKLDLSGKQFHIPQFPIPENKKIDQSDGSELTPEKYLRRLCSGGLKLRYGVERVATDKLLSERLDYELGVIEEMGFSSYFLIVWDFIKWARDNDIPVGPGRGSAVGSLVSYCLRITDLCPLKYELFFERFLNPSRISMPDIDVDFCINGREKVMAYVTQKYGSDRVAGITIFNTLASRAAIRDAGRVMEVPLPIVDGVAKLIPSGPNGLSISQSRKEIAELIEIEKKDQSVKLMLDMAERIEGFVKSHGTHAAGVVISDTAITDYIPLIQVKKSKSEESSVNTQYEMKWPEKLGLLKMDFLGLRNLTIMKMAENEIRRTINPKFKTDNIPDNDKKTFEMLARGETSGVFQLESPGMTRMLVDMKIDNLLDIVAAVALYRPGPMELIPDYIAGKHGKKVPTYLHPKLEPILKETFGIAIYQEQVMLVAREIAGFSMADADNLRKVMGKKDKSKIAGERTKFVEGSIKQDVAQNTAERIFDFIEPFAGYGFNKSHAVAYGWIAYQTAYLKANYPKQYLAALLSSVSNKTDKLIDYIIETRERHIQVLPPDVNISMNDFAVSKEDIRFGFHAIKGVTPSSVQGIIEERQENGPYTTIFDLVTRTKNRSIQKRTVEALIKVGACDTLPGNRNQLISALESAFDRARLDNKDALAGQMNFFGEIAIEDKGENLPNIPEPTQAQCLKWEHEGLGIYVTGHPVEAFQHLLTAKKTVDIITAKKANDNKYLLVGGMIGPIKRIRTKAGEMMIVSSIEDRNGSLEVILYPRQYEAHQACFIEGSIVAISGQIKSREMPAIDAITNDDGELVEVEQPPTERKIIVSGVEEIRPANAEPQVLELAISA